MAGKAKKRQCGRKNEILTCEDFYFLITKVKMTDKQALVFHAYFWQHKTMTEIAAELGVSFPSVRDKIERCKAKLWKYLTSGF